MVSTREIFLLLVLVLLLGAGVVFLDGVEFNLTGQPVGGLGSPTALVPTCVCDTYVWGEYQGTTTGPTNSGLCLRYLAGNLIPGVNVSCTVVAVERV